jgi:hypothetical protein
VALLLSADFVDLIVLIAGDGRDSVFLGDLAWRRINDGNAGGAGAAVLRFLP